MKAKDVKIGFGPWEVGGESMGESRWGRIRKERRGKEEKGNGSK